MFIKIGTITSFHGLKSEIKVLLDDDILNNVSFVYVGDSKQKEKIISKRYHKNHVLIKFEGYKKIEDVYKYRNKDIFIKEEDTKEFLINELIDFLLFEEEVQRGKILNIRRLNKNILLEVMYKNKKVLVPFHKDLIKNIDKNNKTIIIFKLKGLFDEN